MDSELHRAVDRKHGKYSSIRVVHPMTTYRTGRNKGFAIGVMLVLIANLGHEAYFHGSAHADLWAWILAPIALFFMLREGLHSVPNKIAYEIRKSIDIYRDE